MSLLLFRTNHPVYLILLPFFALIFWIPAFIVPTEISIFTNGVFDIQFQNRELGLVLGWIVVVFEGIFLSQVVNERDFFKPGTYLPALMYILLMVTRNDAMVFNSLHIANFFIILALRRSLSVYGKTKNKQEAFDAGFFIGIASLFNLSSILIVLAPLACLIIVANLNLKELIISLYGLLSPWVFTLCLFYVLGIPAFSDGFTFSLQLGIPKAIITDNDWWFAGIFIVLTLFSLMHYVGTYARGTLKTKNEKRVVLIYLVVQLITLVFSGLYAPGFYLLPFLAVPLSVYFSSYFFSSFVKWFADLLFLAWLGVISYNYFHGLNLI